MGDIILKFLLCTYCVASLVHSGEGSMETRGYKSETISNDCLPLQRLDVLPGLGVDIIRLKEMAPVTVFTYKECKMTADRKLLIPDQVHLISEKKSNVEIHSEVIENYLNYKSFNSRSMEIEASYSGSFNLAGKYSEEYQSTKQKQVDDKTVAVRIAATYTMYTVGLHLPMQLAPELKTLFENSLESIKENNTEKTDLFMELLLRDFGTHVTTTIKAGAMITKEDFVLKSFVENFSDDKQTITAEASGDFFGTVKFGASYQQISETNITVQYKRNTVSSHVQSFGGTFFKPNMTVDNWIETIPTNLVSIDKSGMPLEYIIRPEVFPGVSLEHISILQKEYVDARTRYFELNRHVGCMNTDSENFDYSANIQKNCQDPYNNYTFGGVYQVCKSDSSLFFHRDFCPQSNLNQKNLATGDFSCPPSYTPILLKSGRMAIPYSASSESCGGGFLGLFEHCNQNYYTAYSAVHYETYWCAATDGVAVAPTSGMMFGGLYSSKIENPITKARSCPPTYYDMKVLQDLHICGGTDYEEGHKFSVKLGGFFSCQHGNPLYDVLKPPLVMNSLQSGGVSTTGNSDQNFHKSCPHGYTQHTAVVEEDCPVMYCTEAGAFTIHGQVPIVLPPFRNISIIYTKGNFTSATADSSGGSKTFFGGFGAGIASCVLILLIIIILLIVKKRRQYHRIRPSDIQNEEATGLLSAGEGSQDDAV